MDKKQLKKVAENYVKEQLGEEQFANNKDAKKAIYEDFMAGFKAAKEFYAKKIKAYDELDEAVSKFYDEDDEDNQDQEGLISIGEICAQKLGYL